MEKDGRAEGSRQKDGRGGNKHQDGASQGAAEPAREVSEVYCRTKKQ